MRTQPMISTYVISLERSQDRRTFIRDHLGALGIPFRFFDAIDGRKMTGDTLMKAAPKGGVDYCGMLTAAEIGGALSHLAVIREIAEGQNEYAAVRPGRSKCAGADAPPGRSVDALDRRQAAAQPVRPQVDF